MSAGRARSAGALAFLGMVASSCAADPPPAIQAVETPPVAPLYGETMDRLELKRCPVMLPSDTPARVAILDLSRDPDVARSSTDDPPLRVKAVAWSAHERLFSLGGADRTHAESTITPWNGQSGEPSFGLGDQKISDHIKRGFDRIVTSPDGRTFAVTAREEIVLLDDSRVSSDQPPALEIDREPSPSAHRPLSWSPDSLILVTAGGSGHELRFWDRKDGKLRRTRSAGSGGPVLSLAHSPDGSHLAIGGPGQIDVLESRSDAIVRTFRDALPAIVTVAWAPDGDTLIAGGDDGVVRILSLREGTVRAQFVAHKGEVKSLAVSLDGKLFATSGADDRVFVWDVTTLRLVATPPREPDPTAENEVGVGNVTWAPRGRVLAVARGSLQLFRVDDGVSVWLHAFQGHLGPVGAALTNVGVFGGSRDVSHYLRFRTGPEGHMETGESVEHELVRPSLVTNLLDGCAFIAPR